MAASDPSPYVATPTGTLHGVAAYSWDGSAWQPTAGAGPDVATPTGVLRGVAPFSWSGSAWTPVGRAQPGAATPTGVLDGVAVYTWSGSAWAPPGGTATPSTPSGALRGVAAFSWDGAAWQPAGQAGPSVATPYGVLDGVAMFNWSGTTWAAGAAVPSGATLDLSFLSGTLDPRITFARASTATYFDATGTMRTAATNAPRFDYDPAALTLRGLLIEEARTNLMLQSGDVSNAAWTKYNGVVTIPVVTANQIAAPDGTTTASRIAFPAVVGAAAYSAVIQAPTVTAAAYSFSLWLRGSVGGEQVYLSATPDGATYYRAAATLTTSWQRFVLITPALTAVAWFFQFGVDLRDVSQTSKPAQTIYAWGGQVELGSFSTSYVPTTAAAVTRAIETCTVPTAGWYNAAAYSLMMEHLPFNVVVATYGGISDANFANASYFSNNQFVRTVIATGGTLNFGAVNKQCGVVVAGSTVAVCNNGGAVASTAGAGAAQSTATRLAIGNDPWSLTTAMNAYARRVRFWPRVLSNGEMQSVTT